MKNDIPTKLKGLRKHIGHTQGDFAEKIGLKQSTYSMIESGKNNLSIDILNDIISVFNIDANYFFSDIDINGLNGSITYDKSAIDYGFNDLFLDYRRTVDNLGDVVYMLDRIDSNYISNDLFEELIQLDNYDLGLLFEILEDKSKQKEIEKILSEKIVRAQELLRAFIIDLHILSIGGKVGSQVSANLKDLYESVKEGRSLSPG